MSIRPIDFNGMMQNTQEVSQVRSHEEHRPMVQQDLVSTEIKNEVEVSMTQVHEQSDTSGGELDADGGSGAGYERRGGRKKEKNKKEKVTDGVVRIKSASPGFDMKI